MPMPHPVATPLCPVECCRSARGVGHARRAGRTILLWVPLWAVLVGGGLGVASAQVLPPPLPPGVTVPPPAGAIPVGPGVGFPAPIAVPQPVAAPPAIGVPQPFPQAQLPAQAPLPVAPSAAAVIPGQDPILVNITGPLAAKLGEKVSFEVELVNRSGRPLTGLRVVDYFDRGFHHEASASPIEQRGTIDMAAGTSRRLTLDFFTDEPGRQCHRVEILDQAHTFMGGATECVLVTAPAAAVAAAPAVPTAPAPVPTPALPPPLPVPVAVPPTTSVVVPAPVAATIPPAAAIPVRPPMTATAPPAAASFELDMSGPPEILEGAVGEFQATVRNTGNAPSGPTTLELTWDPIYTPLEGSTGLVLGTNTVSWTLPPIEPRGGVTRQINLSPKLPASARGGQASRAKVKAILSQSSTGVMVADESFVLIRSTAPPLRTPREAGVRVSIADCDDPVQDGGSTRIVCTVTNDGSIDSGRLRLVVNLPNQARVIGDPIPPRVTTEGQTLTFDGINSIPPGGHSTFEVTYKLPAGAGTRATSVATLSGDTLEGRTESECSTTFLGP